MEENLYEKELFVRVSEFLFEPKEGTTRQFRILDMNAERMSVGEVCFDKDFAVKKEISPRKLFNAMCLRSSEVHVMVYEEDAKLSDYPQIPNLVSLYLEKLEHAISVFVQGYREKHKKPKNVVKVSMLIPKMQQYLNGRRATAPTSWRKSLVEGIEVINDTFEFMSDGSLVMAITLETEDVNDSVRRVIYYYLAEIALCTLCSDVPPEIFDTIDEAMRDTIRGNLSYHKKEDFAVEYSIQEEGA